MATRTVRATLKIGGTLVDPTSATLSNEAATMGIVRNDTGASVVAAGTAMTKESTGKYYYTFTEPAAGLSYTAYVKFVANGNTYRIEKLLAASGSGASTAVSFTELQERLARYAFGARSTSSLLSTDIEDINACIKDGLQSVYLAHRWSFMRPLVSITTEADEDTYDLPDGYDAIEGPFTYAAGLSDYYPPVRVVHESEIRRRRQDNEYSDRPILAAVVTAAFSATVGSKRQVVFYPTPDDDYVLTAIMRLRPTMIDAANPYPMGGETLSPVIIESCLAAAESTFRDAEDVHGAKYRELLARAIEDDKDAASPDSLGVTEEGESLSPPRNSGVTVYIDDVLM